MSYLQLVSFMYRLQVFWEKHIFVMFGFKSNLVSACRILGEMLFFMGFSFSFAFCGDHY